MARLGDALRHAEREGKNPVAIAAIRLLVLTGARKSEILNLQWGQIDFERARAHLADSKTGARSFPLAPPALAILAAWPRIENSPYILPGATGRPFAGLSKVWKPHHPNSNNKTSREHENRYPCSRSET